MVIPSFIFVYLNSLDRSISNRRYVWLFLVSPCLKETLVFNANSVDPDRKHRSAASDEVFTVCKSPFYRTLGINGLTTGLRSKVQSNRKSFGLDLSSR